MDNEAEIRSLIGAHIEAKRWGPTSEPDWDRFREDFLPEATAGSRKTGDRQVTRRLHRENGDRPASDPPDTRGMKILRFGNVAVVLAMSELLENGEA